MYAHYYLLSVCLIQNVQTVSHSWKDVQQNHTLCWHSSPSSWWCLRSCTRRLFSQLISDGEYLLSDIMSPILPMPITIFSLSIYCRMHSLALLARHSAKLSSLLTFITPELTTFPVMSTLVTLFHLFLLLISDGERLFSDISHLFCNCLCPLLIFSYLFLYCRMRGQSHTLGNMFSKAELCWCSSPCT